MSVLSRYTTWYGRDEPPVEMLALRAGPLSAILDGIDLRYVRRGAVEVVRRLYVAVRDHNWDTIPGTVTNLSRDIAADHFTIGFDVAHRRGAVDFSWRGRIEGLADGTIRYSMDGQANGPFRYNRIGFCLLHPPAECAARPYRGQTPSGPIEGVLPDRIGPQRIEDGTILPLFPSVSSLAIDLASGVTASFAFEGDLFEMEDQRNWSDASFKTYCTPLALPWPKDAKAGLGIAQTVTITTTALGAAAQADQTRRLDVQLGAPSGLRLPTLGVGMASHGEPLTAREIDLLRALRLDHLRADLHLSDPGYPDRLEQAIAACKALDCALEAAIFLGDDPESELAALASRLASRVPVARVLVFRRDEPVTAGRWVRLARERLSAAVAGAPFAGGTNAYFTDLNRNRPDVGALDAVAYSINPQVHAFDEISLVENLAAQADTVRSARAFSGDLPLAISPITLRPRFNPNATGPEPEPAPGELPPPVDQRQMSLFGAAWTVGSVKSLAESGAASLTYYETTGWRGLMESEAGSPADAPFASRPGMIFPLYYVFADLGEWKGGELLTCRSSDPLRLEALALQTGENIHILVANMTSEEQRFVLGPLRPPLAAVRHLDDRTAALATSDPARFRHAVAPQPVVDGQLALTLAPYATVRIDLR